MGTLPPPPPADFNFDSACNTPYISAPSSPRRFATAGASPEEEEDIICDDFDFEFSGPLGKTYFSAADELFDSGKIKPLKPQSQPQNIRESPAAESALGEESRRRRGREPRPSVNPRHKSTRSLSPFRVSDLLFDHQKQSIAGENINSPVSPPPSFLSTVFSGKWKLKDLFLFRSASEGRASSATQAMKKYTAAAAEEEDGSSGSSVSRRRRRRPAAAESRELRHYTMRRTTVSEELKRKTSLPYKQGLLGCLGLYNQSAHYDFSVRGSTRSSFAYTSMSDR
ncbi:unnamed protein product [Cuscuta campestris]|uniref:Uncharacterized protein n=1 Tax=Cuscuta campestris TaxID=132261 RepID=A0A484KRK6_9ASTE|nr:unnamed protein product [Cuscuta campestris]